MSKPKTRSSVLLFTWLAATALGCEEPQKAPEPLKSATLEVEPTPAPAPAKTEPPKRAPSFEVDETSVKVGYTRFFVDKPSDKTKLRTELEQARQYVDGQEVKITANRKAKLPWLVTYLDELSQVGAKALVITTPTRGDYPTTITLAPFSQANPPGCTPVAAIQEDRSTVTWKLAGGGQTRRGRGLGGPDLSTTGESIARLYKACKGGDTVVLGAHDAVEWGLVYDLVASTYRIEETAIGQRRLLPQLNKAGAKVKSLRPE